MEFAHDWMQMFTAQTQEIYGLIQEVLRKTEPGALDIKAGATPANPIVNGFREIQERAAAMAEKNGESAFMLLEKIGKARTIQDVLTLQAQFARKQMEAYVVQAQDLRRLIHQLQQEKSPTSRAA